ncbi:MAG TPA: TIGR00266 family protein [Terriglobales bacterium]|nr:TIGR00266 family protein [Terriglobales bacterium]
MALCPACQHPLAPGDRFCAACGAALSSASAIAATPTGAPASPAGTLAGAKYSIVGYEMQAAVVSLAAGQTVMAEPGTLLYMRGAVEMNTGMTGGLMSGFKRALAGDSFFLAHFTGGGPGGEAAFAAPYPGTIHPLEIGARQWLCQRHSFLCCSPEVTLSVALSQKLGYGLFSGEGFILQTLGGHGDALVHAGGHFIRMELGSGEQIRVDTGSVVAFDAQVGYTIEFVKGFKNLLFGGEGMFFIVLTGPGTVILQTLSFDRLVSRIAATAASHGGGASTVGTVAGMGALGAILGGVMGGGGNQGGGSF